MMSKTIIFLYSSLPGYMYTCIDYLTLKINENIILVETSVNKNYPIKFNSQNFRIINYDEFKTILNDILLLNIKMVFVSGWENTRIRAMVNILYKKGVELVLLSDQPKKENLHQLIGKLFMTNYLKKFRKIVVPGKLGYDLMLYYGVPKEKIETGLYSSNDSIFNEAKIIRDNKDEYPNSFLFDGQYITRKGVPFLINEYLEYLRLSKNPWKLKMMGKGRLEKIIPEQIENHGFIHQNKLKEIYSNAGCLILPSFEDHWPLVIHQATCAGLPLLISPYCGNYHEFFKANINGYFINPHIKGSLTNAMLKIESMNQTKLKEMGNISFELSKAFSVDKWVEQFINKVDS